MDNIQINPNYQSSIKEKSNNSKSISSNSDNIETDANNSTNNYSKKQIGGAVLATALAATTITGAAFSHRLSNVTKELEKQARNSKALQDTTNQLKGDLERQVLNNKNLEGTIEQLKSELENVTSIVTEDVTLLAEKLKIKIEGEKLPYDIEHPVAVGKKQWNPHEYKFDYPTSVEKPGIRKDIQELDIPEISPEGNFEYTIPKANEKIPPKAKPMEFKDEHSRTNISENYADSVQWDNDKISRDLLQNFYDGHGQTLDGVTLKFVPAENGKYKVRIEGLSTYTPDKAAYIGESSKKEDSKAAGNYGEGLKMVALKLLKDKGASKVKIGSSNWNLSYKLENGNLSDARVLSYDLEKVPELEGNYFEFETDDKSLLESLRNSINRFHHSRNIHFKDPDFENEHFGIKLVPKCEKGALYIAGQRFQFNDSYDGLDNMILYIKEKPPIDVLDPSRDRTTINASQLEKIAEWFAKKCTTQEEKLKVMKLLEDYGSVYVNDDVAAKKFLESFIYQSAFDRDTGFIFDQINFPENYIAYSNASGEVVQNLISKGFKVLSGKFNYVGMRNISDFYGSAREHIAVAPTKVQEQKIKLLKEAIKALKLPEKHFTDAELDTKIYIFDKKNPIEAKMYDDANAEAIIDGRTSNGFWIDSVYLDKTSFTDALETALHELCHKAGGDETSKFSYKLTDVNAEAITKIVNDKQTQNTLAALRSVWDGLSTAA